MDVTQHPVRSSVPVRAPKHSDGSRSDLARRATIAWLLMVPVAIANGVIRELLYKPVVGDLPSHQISTLSGSAAMLGVTYLLLHKEAPRHTDTKLLRLGAIWLLATVLFEFSFGHYVDGKSWAELAADYNITKGHLWPLVLLTIFVSPLLVKRMRLVTG